MKKVNCPNCNKKLKPYLERDTDSYGWLSYYYCNVCKEEYVSIRENELQIAAP